MSVYWDRRYRHGGRSGEGSRKTLAGRYAWRAAQIQQMVSGHDIATTLDIGSGDGAQAAHLDLPGYLGVDVSAQAVALARRRCPDKTFEVLDRPEPRDLHLSLSVMFHLTDDADYRTHLSLLFSANRLVVVHATNRDHPGAVHVRHRRWTGDVPDGWTLLSAVPSWSGADLTLWGRL